MHNQCEYIKEGKRYLVEGVLEPGLTIITDDNTITVSRIDSDGAVWSEDLVFEGRHIQDGEGYCLDGSSIKLTEVAE